MKSTPLKLESYLLDVLLRDLVGHDRSAAAFLVYLLLYSMTHSASRRSARISLAQISGRLGLSKSAVQAALRILARRQLLRVYRQSRTAVPEYFVQRPWLR